MKPHGPYNVNDDNADDGRQERERAHEYDDDNVTKLLSLAGDIGRVDGLRRA